MNAIMPVTLFEKMINCVSNSYIGNEELLQ